MIRYACFLVVLLFLSGPTLADDKKSGVLISKGEEKNLFLFGGVLGPSIVKSVARDTEVGFIHAEARFVDSKKVALDSVFAFHPDGCERLRLASARAPCLILRNHRYAMALIYYQEFVDGEWSGERMASLGGHLESVISLGDNVQKVRIAKVQLK